MYWYVSFSLPCSPLNFSQTFKHTLYNFHSRTVHVVGRVVGIAIGYGLDGPEIESRWKRNFPHLSRPALGPTQPPVQWIPGISRGKERPGRDADPSPIIVPWSWKGRAIPLLPLLAVRPVQSFSACTRVTFTFFTYRASWYYQAFFFFTN